jgi:hypothetical protein
MNSSITHAWVLDPLVLPWPVVAAAFVVLAALTIVVLVRGKSRKVTYRITDRQIIAEE